MATPTVRELVTGHNSGASASVVTGSGTVNTDFLAVFHAEDWDTAANMTAPTGTSGTWTEQTLADLGSNNSHLKIWTRPVTVGGAQTVTIASHSGDEVLLHVYVLSGVGTIQDGVASFTGTVTTTAADAPSVPPTGTDDLLLCAWLSGGAATFDTITAPLSMTNGTSTVDGVTLFSARQVLAASGATGTRSTTATLPNTRPYCSVTLAVKGVTTSTPHQGWGVPLF